MQVSVENVGKLERKLTVRIPAERVDARVRERMRELGQSVRIKGFRPGKVPPKVMEQRFGAQVRNEAMSDVIGRSFQEAVRQENLRPAVAPSIRTSRDAEQGEIEFIATFEVVPDLGTIDVSAIEIEKPVSAVADTDIDAMIETLRQQRKQWTPVERAAAVGDMVMLEYAASGEGFRHPESGMDRVGTILGTGALTPEFEAAIAGLKIDESKTTSVTFPADFRQPAVAGKTASVEFKVVRIQEGSLPAVDEAFAASFGITEGGVEKFRSDVRANLERELNGSLRAKLKAETVGKLVAANQHVDVPNSMVETEARAMLAQARQQAQRVGVTPPDSTDLFKADAAKRVLAFLLLNEIGRQHQIQVDQRRVADELAMIASTYEEPHKVVEMYSRDEEVMTTLRNRVHEDQVVEWIVAHAKVSEKPLAFQDAMKPGF
jgi:trigger factor